MKLKPEVRKWWLSTPINGQPVTLEIAQINGKEVEDSDNPPEIKPDDEVTVDRGFLTFQQMDMRGTIRISGFADIRTSLGAFFVPQNMDLSDPKDRREVSFQGSALFQGPYIWLNIKHPGESQILDIVGQIYSPPSKIIQPDKQPLVEAGPGALGAMGQAFNHNP